MPTLIVATDTPDGQTIRLTLSERIVADNLESRHYAFQLIERIMWAVADAQSLENALDMPESELNESDPLDIDRHPGTREPERTERRSASGSRLAGVQAYGCLARTGSAD